MKSKQDFLNAFAKLLNVEDLKDSSKFDLYNKIYKTVHTDFLNALNSSSYPRAHNVVKKMYKLLDYMENIVSLDYIIDKHKTYLQYNNTNEGFQAIQDIFEINKVPANIRFQKNTYPIVVLPAPKFKIEVLNSFNIREEISADEYEILLDYSNQDSFNLSQVVKVFLFYLPSKNNKACSLIDNQTGSLKKLLNDKVQNESFAVSKSFEYEWLDIYIDLKKQINDADKSINAITNDIIQLEKGTKKIKNIRNQLKNLKTQLESELANLQKEYNNLAEKLNEFDSKYAKIESYSIQGSQMFQASFYKALEISEYNICTQQLSLLKKAGYINYEYLSQIFDCVIQKSKIQDFIEYKFNDSNLDFTIARTLIYACDLETYIPAIIEKCVALLQQNQGMLYSAKEFYAMGLFERDADKRHKFYKRSFYAGYEPAANKIWESNINNDNKYIKKLAFDLVPGACVAYGDKLWNDDNGQPNLNSPCLRFYKFASAQNYIPGVERIAEFIYQVYFASYVGEAKEGDIRYKAATLLLQICNYLIHSSTKPRHYQEYKGIALYCLSRYDEAMSTLSGCQSNASHYCRARMWQYSNGTYKDLDKALEEYQKASNFADAPKKVYQIQNMKAREASEQSSSNNYDQKQSYSSSRRSSSSSDSLCFVTTAVCKSLKKGDDCEELQMMRSLRDSFVSSSADGEMLVLEYYRVGPMIVSQIDKHPNSNSIYADLWNRYLKQCCELQRERKFKDALDIYIEMVKTLCSRYNIELNASIVEKFNKVN